MAIGLNEVPTSIPEAQTKQKLLAKEGIENVYLGQGLVFVPPASADADYNAYLISQGIDPAEFPLSGIRQNGADGAVYNSLTTERTWRDMENRAFTLQNGVYVRKSEAFQRTIYDEISGATIENLFGLDAKEVATMQANDLQDGLNKLRSIIAHLAGNYASRVILPAQYQYSGHTDFTGNAKLVGGDIDILEIPEIQADGSQDLQAMRRQFEKVKNEGRVAIMIDQEMNNNASGYDRDPSQNEELANLLKEYQGTIFYVGDIAYKGLKEDILEPYPLMQMLTDKGVTAFHYFSPTKSTAYRKPPSYKSIIFGTPGEAGDTAELRAAFKKSERSPGGIGCTDQGALMMQSLSQDPEFHKEVRTLRLYLKYILNSIGSNTNGIFRCRDPETIARLNSGDVQAVTVDRRENIWPLGDPALREIYERALAA